MQVSTNTTSAESDDRHPSFDYTMSDWIVTIKIKMIL